MSRLAGPTRVLIAPDKFKGTLTAREVCSIIGASAAALEVEVCELPMADGGDGTLDVVLEHGFTAHQIPSVDALGRPRQAVAAWRGTEVLLEMAQVCGLATVLDLPSDPWRASSMGLGLAAARALDEGATEVTLGLGGSASVDGGVGFLQGLGFDILDRSGRPVTPDLAGLVRAARVEQRSDPANSWQAAFRVLVDVSNPLVGPQGAANSFGPQKGLQPRDCARASAALCRWAELLERTFGVRVANVSGGGAAGGVAAAAFAARGATIHSGSAFVADLVGLNEQISWADVVITGEGMFDAQTAGGKAPGLVIEMARAAGKPVHVLAGQCEMTKTDWQAMGISGVATLSSVAGSADLARKDASGWMAVASRSLLADIADVTSGRPASN
jgi:glycerate kinase